MALNLSKEATRTIYNPMQIAVVRGDLHQHSYKHIFIQTCKADLWVVLEGPHIVLAHFVAVHQDAVGILVPEKDPSAIPDKLTLALGHHVQPLAAATLRLPDDIVASLGPAESEHLLLQGKSGKVPLWG